MQLAHTCSDLIKEVMRYNDEQPKKHKLVGAIVHSIVAAACMKLMAIKQLINDKFHYCLIFVLTCIVVRYLEETSQNVGSNKYFLQ